MCPLGAGAEKVRIRLALVAVAVSAATTLGVAHGFLTFLGETGGGVPMQGAPLFLYGDGWFFTKGGFHPARVELPAAVFVHVVGNCERCGFR